MLPGQLGVVVVVAVVVVVVVPVVDDVADVDGAVCDDSDGDDIPGNVYNACKIEFYDIESISQRYTRES